MSQESNGEPTMLDSGDVTALARLIYHVKENNVAYLVGSLICVQLGYFQKLQEYAGGVC